MRTRLERAQNQAVKIHTHIRAHSLSSNYLKNLVSSQTELFQSERQF